MNKLPFTAGIKYLAKAFLILLIFSGCKQENAPSAGVGEDGNFSIFLAGDAVISLEWSHYKEPEFLELIKYIQNADVGIVNLEMLIHDYEGYPQAVSGGTYMRAAPKIADELAWAGIDMVANANNHAFDYGSIGILKTIENVEKAGIKIAGVGKDLQNARSPVYFQSKGKTVALVSFTTTYPFFGAASRSRPDLHGRPGVNPMEVKKPNNQIDFFDLEENLGAVRIAARRADYIIVSAHSHQRGATPFQPPAFMRDMARNFIKAGADIFFAHGPHVIRGVEIYKGRPIFYGLGNFIFQNETITRQPSEYYKLFNLGDDATIEDLYDARSTSGEGVDTRYFPSDSIYWKSFVSVVKYKNNQLDHIKLIPIDLMLGKPRGERGRPVLAGPALGEEIITTLSDLSSDFSTQIIYDKEKNIGIVQMDSSGNQSNSSMY